MKNITISIFFSIFISCIAHSSQENPSRNGFPNLPKRKPMDFPFPKTANSSSNKAQNPNSSNQNNNSNPEFSVFEKIQAIHSVFQMGKDVYSWLPGSTDQEEVKRKEQEQEQYNLALAQQREIDTARRSFYKCCQNNQMLSAERLANGLAQTCQAVAMAYASLGYREDVEEAITFFNKFRE